MLNTEPSLSIQTKASLLEETVTICIEKIKKQNTKWHAIAKLLEQNAVDQVQQKQKIFAESGEIGPLAGLPIVVKELVDIKGLTTEFGSFEYAQGPAKANAPVIDLLERAGAIVLGTAHMVEFAIGSWGTNPMKGTPWNPADPKVHRVAGGSSSGSAVAVAADLVPAAIGSDTGGSIRIPASLCGVIGYKPTYGLISNQAVAPLGPTFDTLGPLTHTVEQAKILTEVMSEQDLSHEPVQLKGLTVAIVNPGLLEPIDEQIKTAYDLALQRLEDCGATISEIKLPLSFTEFQALNGDIVSYEIYNFLGHIADRPTSNIDPDIRKRVLAGKKVTKEDYRKLLDQLSQVRETFYRQFRNFDVLILPGTPICAKRLSEVDESEIPMSRYTRIANCLDLCAISLPLTLSKELLPIGWQLCSLAHRDDFLLSLAQTISVDEILGDRLRALAKRNTV
ncbi:MULTISPECIES: amidase [unclassified Vibrio]|uniref:Amidase n=1 Tax=Vibrio sp. HB236076 TaxID=3232307 RepID=A0AB39HIP5_9VIBR|nr:amidase [Vibrio sp. HB161653]MDP5254665.1 amidase [Vibrio sp. HB161653]